jgi:DNA-binding transcriptional regulator of glucitol operon
VSSRYLRPQALIGHVLVLAAALTCLRLGWWQWNVFEATRGTAQNLGYALLWPVFAGSFIYMWLRFLQLESARDAAESTRAQESSPGSELDAAYQQVSDAAGEVGDAVSPGYDAAAGGADAGTSGRAGLAPGLRHTRPNAPTRESRMVGMGYVGVDDEDDPELAAYNRALARLAEEDEGRAR